MPLPFAPLLAVGLGALFAWLARGELARDDGPLVAARSFAIVAAFAGFVFTPAVGYFVAFHGDWAYLYFVPWRAIPSAVDLAFVLLAGGCVPLGFAIASRAARSQKFGGVATIGGVPVGAGTIFLLVMQHRLATSATYAEFHGGFGTESVVASALGRGILWMGFSLLLGVAWCAYSIRDGAPRPPRQTGRDTIGRDA
ncbi:MAG: hypothetical protein ACRELY_13770 [Polyangiaceae bacterium]